MHRRLRRAVLVGTLVMGGAGIAGAQAPAPAPVKLTLQDAEAMALRNHPQVLAAQDEVSVAGQEVTENKSAYYPFLAADLTGAAGNPDGRIGAGELAASRLFDRFGQGVVLNQLVTDLGRTQNLVASSRLHLQAATETSKATRYDVQIAVIRSYFGVLRAQAVLKVAEETVSARQVLDDQVTELAKNDLRSQLDVSFADVNVSQAKLLVLDAQDGVQAAFAELTRALGADQTISYQLVDEPLPEAPPLKADDLVAQAMANRPEISSLQDSRDSAYKFAAAEKDLSRPSVTAVGVAGALPLVKQEGGTTIPDQYEGAAVNVNIPIFNGHLFGARRDAAHFRAMEADQQLRDAQERVARDVRVAWSSAQTGYQRIDVTAQFMRQAALAMQLAQGRYDLGLSDVVALTLAQLNITQAEIDNLNAKYDYQTDYSALQYAIGLLR